VHRGARIADQTLEPDQIKLMAAESQQISRSSGDEKPIGVGRSAVWL
jgi:hypothetical protein